MRAHVYGTAVWFVHLKIAYAASEYGGSVVVSFMVMLSPM